MLTFEIAAFYYLAFFLISGILAIVNNEFLFSIVKGLLIVFVSSEFWEIPIFLMAYLGVPGYGFPDVIHHVLIIGMAFVLLRLIDFQVNWFSILVPTTILIFNYFFLIIYPGVISPWILRSLSLIGISAVVLRREKLNG